ncbi:hypothetical protein GMMP15_1090010 [Candidatus Magnetomoraceae bacterium gMMP-15]
MLCVGTYCKIPIPSTVFQKQKDIYIEIPQLPYADKAYVPPQKIGDLSSLKVVKINKTN